LLLLLVFRLDSPKYYNEKGKFYLEKRALEAVNGKSQEVPSESQLEREPEEPSS